MIDLIEKLQLLDIPRREAEVYLALLQKKEFTGPEIGKITSVSRTKSYEVLQNLVKKGLCNEIHRNGLKVFSAVNPKIVFENLLFGYEEKKKVADQLYQSLSAMYKEKEKDSSPLDYIEVLTDITQIRERFLTIQRNTKTELVGFTRPPYALPLENNINEATEIIKNKIICRSIYEYGSLKSNEEKMNLIKMIEKYQDAGEEAKIAKELPMKLIISDATITVFALNDRVSLLPSITTMIVDHPSFAIALKNVFESYWANSLSIEEFKNTIVI